MRVNTWDDVSNIVCELSQELSQSVSQEVFTAVVNTATVKRRIMERYIKFLETLLRRTNAAFVIQHCREKFGGGGKRAYCEALHSMCENHLSTSIGRKVNIVIKPDAKPDEIASRNDLYIRVYNERPTIIVSLPSGVKL